MTSVLSKAAPRLVALGGLSLALAAGTAVTAAEAHATAAAKPMVRHYKVDLSKKKPFGPCTIKSRYSRTVDINFTKRQHPKGLIQARVRQGVGGKYLGGWVTLKVRGKKYTLAKAPVRTGATICVVWKTSKAGNVSGNLYF